MTTCVRIVALVSGLAFVACGDASDAADTDTGSSSTTMPTTTASSSGASTTAATTTAGSGITTGMDDSGTTVGTTAGTTVGDSSGGDSSGGGTVSPGCGNAAAATGETARNVMIAGVDRSYLVDAPASIDPEQPLSLVFVFHGNGGTGQGIQGMGLQWVDGAQDQAVFVFPDGLQYMNFGVGWDGVCEEYDMEFFDTMVASLSSEYCIDADRIFAAGFSWGGDMCQALACCRGDVVRAIAPASGPEFYPSQYPAACPDTERPAFRMTYATNDAYPPQMFADTIAYYRDQHGCSLEPTPTDPTPCVAYQGCDEPVIACEYEGLGHAWPADWADQTWAFFTSMP